MVNKYLSTSWVVLVVSVSRAPDVQRWMAEKELVVGSALTYTLAGAFDHETLQFPPKATSLRLMTRLFPMEDEQSKVRYIGKVASVCVQKPYNIKLCVRAVNHTRYLILLP